MFGSRPRATTLFDEGVALLIAGLYTDVTDCVGLVLWAGGEQKAPESAARPVLLSGSLWAARAHLTCEVIPLRGHFCFVRGSLLGFTRAIAFPRSPNQERTVILVMPVIGRGDIVESQTPTLAPSGGSSPN